MMDRPILPALATPFVEGAVSPERLRDNIARYERLDLGGYLVLGSTGEAVFLDASERRRILETARGAIPRQKAMVAGVFAESTMGAVEQARAVAGCGADLVLVGTPHYYASQMTAEALTAHYEGVAAGSPVPILLYNVPKFTGVSIPLPVVSRLSLDERVAGIKESSGDLGYLSEVVAQVREGFRVFCGSAARVRSALEAGAAGAILAAGVALPEPFRRIARGVASGDAEAAAKLQDAIAGPASTIGDVYGIPGLKAAMDLRGLYGGPVRGPLQPAPHAVREEVSRIIDLLVDSGVLRDREL